MRKIFFSLSLFVSFCSHAQILGGGTSFSNAVLFNQSWLSGCPGGGTTFSNQAAFEPATAMDACAPAPACATGTTGSDIWFSFFAQSTTATLVVTPGSSFDVAIQAFSGTTCPGLTTIGCTDAAGNNGAETLSLTGLTNGVRYYFRIFGATNGVGNRTGTYTFCGSAGLGSSAAIDDDKDGIPDSVEGSADTDGDGVINSLDLDSDNDGIADIVEAGGADTNGDGRVDGAWADADGDGLHDTYDASTGGDLIQNRDTDGDGIPNIRDLDSDNDGIPDVVEAGGADTNNDGKIDGFTDTDFDGFAQSVDGDVNNDGIADNTANALIITGTDTDSDGDPDSYPRANSDRLGLPDPYDLDADGDGILDTAEAGLPDSNNDGIADGTLGTDGWSDSVDGLAGLSISDSDGDGKPNYLDIDADNDGLTDNVEGQTTAGYQLPSGLDIDVDGIDDIYDNNPAAFAGNANNGITPYNNDGTDTPDYIDSDSDNDGITDLKEGTGNLNITLANTADTDGDGLIDQFDIFNLNTTTINIQNNVTLAGMGNGGSLVGPISAGSSDIANQTPGGSPIVRDWRNFIYILPVRFIDVMVTAAGNNYTVDWIVADELNVKEYIVERSFDGQSFTAVGTISYRFNNGGLQTYSFTDAAVPVNNAVVFYRIRETDIDGRFMISKTIVYRVGDKKNGLIVLGNPVSGNEVTLNISAARSGTAILRIIDVKGRVLASQKQSITTGDNTVRLSANTGYLSNGTYIIQAVINGKQFVQKLTKNN
jgi:hypothetical protein